MTDKFSMADLTASLLAGEVRRLPAPEKTQAAEQEGEGASPLPVVSEAAQRPVRRRPDGAAQAEVSSRQLQRDARALAEAWLQALRAWHVHQATRVISSRTASGGGGNMRFLVGQYTSGSGSVSAGLSVRELSTPVGWVAESAVVRRCAADPLLSEVQEGRGLATLIHASGRGWAGQRAREYAAVLLALAHSLGDSKATEVLHLAFAEDRDTLSVELDQ